MTPDKDELLAELRRRRDNAEAMSNSVEVESARHYYDGQFAAYDLMIRWSEDR